MVHDLYKENYKSLLEYIKENIKHGKAYGAHRYDDPMLKCLFS